MDLTKFQETVSNQTDRQDQGTLREVVSAIYGPKGRIRPAKGSLTSTKKYVVQAFNEDTPEKWVTLYCSQAVSDLLRAKEIRLTHLFDFPVIYHTVGEAYANAGVSYNLIALPTSTTEVGSVGVAEVASEAFSPTFDPADLIAL